MSAPDIPADIAERAEILVDQFRHIEDDREFVARILMEVGQGASAHLGLTPPQAAVLDFIQSYVAEQGHSPSYSQISSGCGFSSKGYVHNIVHQLKERGAIAMLPGRVRTLAIAGRA